jgi:hypothetical protein
VFASSSAVEQFTNAMFDTVILKEFSIRRAPFIISKRAPDSLNSAYSFEKPSRGSFDGEVIEQNMFVRIQNVKNPLQSIGMRQ